MVDSLKIAMSSDPKMTRFALNMQKRSDLREANPNAYYKDLKLSSNKRFPTAEGKIGGALGDGAEQVGHMADPIVLLSLGLIIYGIRKLKIRDRIARAKRIYRIWKKKKKSSRLPITIQINIGTKN
ncbi:hypothetical protein Nwat_0826 [Nitrosococcus watsonii C-113]|uniref:Uncharacterized protein n=2 Tax=Nitrosococcus TaxID=1227 RepID=D8K481_NITWC|nr:hypothetical protein Nwat_0826 [Nitrosococcus watsonii C-113]